MSLQALVSGHNDQTHEYEIFMFSHRSAKRLSEFLELRTANNTSMTITPGHCLFLNEGRDLLRAADAKLGDCVLTLPESQPGGSSVLTPTKVVHIQPSMHQGLYNPHTFSGTIELRDRPASRGREGEFAMIESTHLSRI